MLTETVAVLQRDMHEMKVNYKEQSDELTNTVNNLIKEKEGAQTRAKKHQMDMKNFKTQLTKCEKANEVNNENLKQLENNILLEREKIRKQTDVLETNVNNNKEDILDLENTTKKLSVNIEKKMSTLKSDITQTKEKISDCLNISKRFDDEQLNGVASLKNSLKVTTQKIKQCDSDFKEINDTIEQLKSSTSSLQKQQNELKKIVRDQTETTRITKRNETSTRKDTSNGTVSTQTTIPLTNRFNVLDTNETDGTENSRANSRSSNVTRNEKSMNGSETEKPRIEEANRIPVHCPSSACHNYRNDNSDVKPREQFVGFKQVNRRKIRRFYIHGINKASSSEEIMRDFLERNRVQVTFLRYFEKDWKKTASAQLNVIDEGECVVENKSFGPEGIYVRSWLPRDAFLNEHGRG